MLAKVFYALMLAVAIFGGPNAFLATVAGIAAVIVTVFLATILLALRRIENV